MRNVSQRNLLAVQVPWVEPEMQAEIVRRLTDLRAAEERLEYGLTRARKRSVVLRRALLEAAFTGRLIGRRSDREVVEQNAAQQVENRLEPVS